MHACALWSLQPVASTQQFAFSPLSSFFPSLAPGFAAMDTEADKCVLCQQEFGSADKDCPKHESGVGVDCEGNRALPCPCLVFKFQPAWRMHHHHHHQQHQQQPQQQPRVSFIEAVASFGVQQLHVSHLYIYFIIYIFIFILIFDIILYLYSTVQYTIL